MRRLFALLRAILASVEDALAHWILDGDLLVELLSPAIVTWTRRATARVASPSTSPALSKDVQILAAGVDIRPAARLRLQLAVALGAGGTA